MIIVRILIVISVVCLKKNEIILTFFVCNMWSFQLNATAISRSLTKYIKDKNLQSGKINK